MNDRFKRLLIGWAMLSSLGATAQTLSLEKCYELARQNYPAARQHELIAKSRDYSVMNAAKGYLPQVSFTGQATYQSEVTRVPISFPGVDIPTPGKDQYKIYGEVNQTLFDGGAIRQQKEAQEANAAIEQQKLETELYKLKERVNQLFFGILMLDEQVKQVNLLKRDLDSGIKKIQAGIDNGVVLKSNLDNLKAELLRADQRIIELNASRSAYLDMLGLFTNQTFSATTTLVRPLSAAPTATLSALDGRPEIAVFNLQNRAVDVQQKLINIRKLPRLGAFLQTGFGRPALNMLSNNFEPYFIGGLRLNWTLSSFYTEKNDRELLALNRAMIAVQRDLFLFNTDFSLRQQNAEMLKFRDLLSSDQEIIDLRNKIKTTSLAQLENGVINTNDYLREVNAEDQARQNKVLHEVQLLMAQYQIKTTTGQN